MSLRAAQNHKKVAGQDTTSLMTSSTQRDDPTATMWCRSSCRTCFAYRELYCLKVVEHVLLLIVVNYVMNLMMCVNYIGDVYELFMYSLPVLEAPHPERQPKHAVVKNNTLISVC
jgi:hypothetical protein